MSFPDLSKVPDSTRIAMADKIRQLKDIELPEMKFWNYGPCEHHLSIEDGQAEVPPCQYCGILPRKHQRVGIMWLYIAKKGLIADSVGSGKTTVGAGLLAVCKEVGAINGARAVVVVRPSALLQWKQQLTRMIPNIRVITATGTRKERVDRYLEPWDVCLIGYQMLAGRRGHGSDMEMLINFNVKTVIVDDVDALRNRENATAYAIKRLARDADRVVIMTGTPLQKRLHELHSVLEPIGGREIFGSETAFKRRYVRTEKVRFFNPRMGKYMNKEEVVGYKNLREFSALVAPLSLRRTAADIDDVSLPAVQPSNVFLDLHPAQQKKYEELKKGVLTIIKKEGANVKRAKAAAAWIYGQQICGGLAALGEADGPGTSVKLDWVMNMVDEGDLSDEKVVIFINFKKNIYALESRLQKANIGYVVISGDEPDKEIRFQRQQQFWQDPECRVLIGTTAIEQSLNLQVARHLINVDTILNPARMEQLSGRIRRDGSGYKTVYVHNLFASNTQEAGYLNALRREQGLINFVWGEESELYESLSPLALLQLIGES